jgi:hypothetical protein
MSLRELVKIALSVSIIKDPAEIREYASYREPFRVAVAWSNGVPIPPAYKREFHSFFGVYLVESTGETEDDSTIRVKVLQKLKATDCLPKALDQSDAGYITQH